MNQALAKISAVIITKNAAETIARTLDSLVRFSEVVVYDNGSTDGTLELLAAYPNVRLHQGDFLGFGPTKNLAVSLASHDWVFSIDADEVLPQETLDELDDLGLDEARKAYFIKRTNLFMDKPVRHSGWGKDWLLRLFNRQVHVFTDAMVHEHVVLHGESQRHKLRGEMLHYAVNDVAQFLNKINRYSEIRKESASKTYSLPTILLKTYWAFFRTYVLRRGILDGWRGLVISISNANGVFYKNIKIYAKKHQ